MARIISLSSIPPRFSMLPHTLESLRRQQADIDEIRLYIPRHYRRFPDAGASLPDLGQGVRVIRTDEDLGPASKVLFASRDLAGQDCAILFCDDDQIYPENWAATLFAAQAARPDHAVAGFALPLHRVFPTRFVNPRRPAVRLARSLFDPGYRLARLRQQWQERRWHTRGPKPSRRLVARAGYADVVWGCAGVVVRPEFFDARALDIPDAARPVDDIWLSGMLALNQVPIWVPTGLCRATPSPSDSMAALRDQKIDGRDRDASNRACLSLLRARFGIWPDPAR